MGGIGHGGHVLLVIHGSFECSSVHHNVIKPFQCFTPKVTGWSIMDLKLLEGLLLEVEGMINQENKTSRVGLFLSLLATLRWVPWGGKHEGFPVSCAFPRYPRRKNPSRGLLCYRGLQLWLRWWNGWCPRGIFMSRLARKRSYDLACLGDGDLWELGITACIVRVGSEPEGWLQLFWDFNPRRMIGHSS